MREGEKRGYAWSANGQNELEDVRQGLTVSRSDGVTTLAVSGALDLLTVSDVRAALKDEVALAPSRVVLDVSALEFIDSAGLHAIVQTSHELSAIGGALELAGVPDAVRRVLEITGLDALLAQRQREVVGDVESA